MFIYIFFILSGIKILLIPTYHSTDFEVHRNWLAITHSLPVHKWYYESTSEWTLDYPPLFAWFEYGLSHVAKYFDPKMLEVSNLNYASHNTILFQRLSVIVTDVVYAIGVKRCSDMVTNGKLLIFILLFANPGLLMVDHIHFQYNGILFGILLLSIADMLEGHYIRSALWFAVLLNMKHIFIYIAPVYIIYLFRVYCFTVSSKDGYSVAWYSFSPKNLVKLGAVVLSVFAVSFGPFIHHIPQILSRLFPFKRGLCHAYWAPNFWALYNAVDKSATIILPRFGHNITKLEGTMTSGLVQEYSHTVLPSVYPAVTFLLTVLSILPALLKLWILCADKEKRHVYFIRCLSICALSSFLFGWHVHEKAILMTIIPMSLLAAFEFKDGKVYTLLSVVGHFSLFPLLYPKYLSPVKVFMLLTHSAVAFNYIPSVFDQSKSKNEMLCLPMLNKLETLYVLGLCPLFLYEACIHSLVGLEKKLPFLPLMLVSIYCSIGLLYLWITYYYSFMSTAISHNKKKMKLL